MSYVKDSLESKRIKNKKLRLFGNKCQLTQKVTSLDLHHIIPLGAIPPKFQYLVNKECLTILISHELNVKFADEIEYRQKFWEINKRIYGEYAINEAIEELEKYVYIDGVYKP